MFSFDPKENPLVFGWLPKPEALFTTVKGGDIIVIFRGLSIQDCGDFRRVNPAPVSHQPACEVGVTHMGFKVNKRTHYVTYTFGTLNSGLNPGTPDFVYMCIVQGKNFILEDVFDHEHYFLNRAPEHMGYLKPVCIRD